MEISDMTIDELREAHRGLLTRYASMEEAAAANEKEAHRLAGEASRLKNDVIRLADEARASQQNAQLLGDDFNERSRSAAAEIIALRERLKAIGLDPDVN